MLLNPKTSLFGVSQLYQERRYSHGVAWTVPCSLDCSAKTRLKDYRYIMMSPQLVEKVTNNIFNKENLQDLPVSSAYETAMEALSSLITSQKRGGKLDMGVKYKKLDRMSMYIQILGLEEHIADLKIIHVAGTKGKGSTCTFCEAILRECGFKTGLFTSPHLVDVRERFRLSGLDISEEQFLLHFWDCWNRLKEKVTENLPMPPLFQFLTILAFKIFIWEKVDVAIIEVGLGGKDDSTNVIKEPIVCGITSLGMDHTEVLGDTLGQITSHKAGIFKPRVPAFTVPQLSEAMDVLQQRAHELKVPLEVAAPLTYKKLNGIKLSLSGDHQLVNSGLAISLCKSWLSTTGNWGKLFQNDTTEGRLPEAFLRGLSTAHLSGRAQIVRDSSLISNHSTGATENSSGNLVFYLDGAHSPESMEACARWFSDAIMEMNYLSLSSSSKIGNLEEVRGNNSIQHSEDYVSTKESRRILLFNCMEVRDPEIILPRLVNICAASGSHFSKAIFVPSISTYNKVTSGASAIPSDIPARDLLWQFNLQRIWEKIIHGKEIVLDKSGKMETVDILPPHKFLSEDVSQCNPSQGNFGCGAVLPSLPATINWLRDCARENPSLRFQVLVTGSLHLVGDVLKVLRR